MIVTTLLALAPVALALPSVHDAAGRPLHKRTGPPAGTTLVPSVTNGGTTWYNRGCYDELKSGLMALNHDISSTLSSITVENCVTGCSAAGYIIAGVMNGNQCLCDNAISILAPALDQTQCNIPCTGNNAEVCGGTWHYEIYTPSITSIIPNPAPPTTVGSGPGTYTLIGCYKDNTSARTLPSSFSSSDTQTPAACAATCYSLGYSLAGVEWGKECYCADVMINPDLTALTDCSQACAGDSTQTCGGEGTINVYSQDDDTPTTTTPASSSIPSTSTTSSSSTSGQPNTTSGQPNTTSTRPTSSAPPATTSHHSRPPRPQPTCGSGNNGYLHLGCYADNSRQRTLNSYSFTSSSMTAETCSSKCYSKGFSYAGLENGNTCYCGNNCPSRTTSLDNCNKSCGGDSHHIGGGSTGTLTIYKSFSLGYPQKCLPKPFGGRNNNGGRW